MSDKKTTSTEQDKKTPPGPEALKRFISGGNFPKRSERKEGD